MDKHENQPPPPPYDMAQGVPQYPPQGAPQYPPQYSQQYPPQGAPQHPQQGAPQYPPQGAPQYPQQYPQQYPPQGAPPMAHGTTVIMAPPIVMVNSPMLGTNPTAIQCPRCQANVVTQPHYQSGVLTWLIAGLLFFFFLWPFCLIPFCINDCKDVVHTCPNCKSHIGRRTRLS
ncbi:hypothetical protein EB796_018786 [Bugula neritina]|uniref:LITAF domain-containing protein n=1 Tax=Bugula neritina TaxID=10212 RepID=A0A7J7J9J3_BUGNE|nr:hypothetical protein EB796_018786 [Bugula neritina]